jgi:hypothetical protein
MNTFYSYLLTYSVLQKKHDIPFIVLNNMCFTRVLVLYHTFKGVFSLSSSCGVNNDRRTSHRKKTNVFFKRGLLFVQFDIRVLTFPIKRLNEVRKQDVKAGLLTLGINRDIPPIFSGWDVDHCCQLFSLTTGGVWSFWSSEYYERDPRIQRWVARVRGEMERERKGRGRESRGLS